MKGKILICLSMMLLLLVTGLAQKRTTRSKPKPTQTRPITATKPPVTDLRPEANAVAEQLKLLSRFIYLYGRVSNTLETAEAQERRRELTRTQIEQNKKSRETLVANINSYRAGLEQLAQKIQANPRLQFQHLKMVSATDSVAEAEQLAAEGKYDEAGRALVRAAEKLAEVVAEIR